MPKKLSSKFNYADFLWDLWCTLSIVGIWPRYIEPNLLRKKLLKLTLPTLKSPLKIAVFSDLHLHPDVKNKFLNKLSEAINSFNPDLVFFVGDFICDGQFTDEEQLIEFFRRFNPPQGAFAVLGNHDYSEPVSINEYGDYDVSIQNTPFKKAFRRLFKPMTLTKIITEQARSVPLHEALIGAINKTPFKLLQNETVQAGGLNITGLGEYVLGRADPEKAFNDFEKSLPGVVLVHNPDMIPKLSDTPGELFLSGHTHGGQVNLPWIWKKLTMMEDIRFKEGLVKLNDKTAYITRGVGSVKPFRWNASPELLLLEVSGMEV